MFCSCILPLSTTVSTSTAETLTALINQNLNDANVLSGNLPVKLLSGCSFTDVFYFELIQFNAILLNIKLFNLIQFNAILLNIKLFNFIQLIFGLNKHCEHCHCFHQISNKSVSLWRKSIIRIKRFIDVSLIQNELHLNKSHTNTGLFLTTLNISSRHTHTHTHTHSRLSPNKFSSLSSDVESRLEGSEDPEACTPPAEGEQGGGGGVSTQLEPSGGHLTPKMPPHTPTHPKTLLTAPRLSTLTGLSLSLSEQIHHTHTHTHTQTQTTTITFNG